MITPTRGCSVPTVKGAATYLSGRVHSSPIRRESCTTSRLAQGLTCVALGGAISLFELGCTAPLTEAAAPVAAPDPEQGSTLQSQRMQPRELVLTEAERAWRAELATHFQHLNGLGERSIQKHWELADAADYLATQWEQMGYALERQGYDVGEVVAQNIEVSVSGAELGRESIIVGAHYDASGSEGADNATGVAALLVLSRVFRDRKPSRKVRFVGYALGDAPHVKAESMGSLRHARQVAAKGEAVVAMLSLDSLGSFNHEPGSQRALDGVDVPLPNTGNFYLLLGSENAESISRTLIASCPATGGIELLARTRREGSDSPLVSDDWPYRQAGVPAVLVSDTKAFRTVGPHGSAGPDLDRLSRLVGCLERGIGELADAPGEKDAEK